MAPPFAAFVLAAACGSDPPTADPKAAGPLFPATDATGGTSVDVTGKSTKSNSRSCTGGPGADKKCGGVVGDDEALGATDCCETRVVPGGAYNRFNSPDFPATVAAFKLDTFLVTAGRFRSWVDATKGDLNASAPPEGAGANPKIPNSGWRSEWNRFLPTSRSDVDHMLGPEFETEGFLACQYGTDINQQGALTWWTADYDQSIKTSTTDAKVRAENAKEALDRKPLNCLPWHVLFAFCIWDGGRLPTDAEFGFAAAGGAEQRDYPWGKVEDSARIGNIKDAAFAPTFEAGKKFVAARLWDKRIGDGSNTFEDNYGLTWGTNTFGEVDGALHIMPVGRRPAGNGKWGQADLAGGMFEWMLDEGPIRKGTCNNCANVNFPKPAEYDAKARTDNPDYTNKTEGGIDWWRGGARAIRGSAWDNAILLANKQSENDIEFYTSYPVLRTYRSLGGRCARDYP